MNARGWEECSLGSIVTMLSGGTPRKSNPDYWGGDIPWISGSTLSVERLSESDRRVTAAALGNGTRLAPIGATLILVRGMSLHEEIRVGQAVRPVAFNQDVKALVPHAESVDSHFLTYAVLAQRTILLQQVHQAGHGTGVLATERLSDLQVLLPPLAEQRRIAGVLGALDDLIETNQKLIRDLRQLAITAFDREASLVKERVALEKLYQVGLSGVWGEEAATEKCTERVAILRGRDLEDLWEVGRLDPPIRFVSAKQAESRRPRIGEIWTAGSGSLGPSVAVTEDLSRLFGGESVRYSNFVKRLVPVEATSWFGAAWLSMVKAWLEGAFENFRTGTAMPNLDVDALFRGVSVPALSPESRLRVNSLVEMALAPDLREEITQLTSTRDELLPLLLSGRVRVGDVSA